MQDMASSYPNAVIIDNPTTTYNCHAYAWHMSEGGTPPVWMGLTINPTPIYWNDGSYFETTERGNGLKVSYDNYPYNGGDMDNHSAITTTEEGVFISKWGAYPLVKHAKDYTPYTYSSLHYFKKNTATISGTMIICSQATYNINNLPTGATVTWNSSPVGFLQLVSGQGTSTAVFSRILNKNNNIISATISINGTTFTIYKFGIQTGTPYSAFEIYDAATDFEVTRVFINKNYYFYGVENAIEDDEYQWTITSPSPYPVTTAIDGRQAYYTASKVGQHLVTLQYNGACGWSDIYSEYVYFETSKKTLLTLSPNPATELVTLAVTENEATDSSILSLSNTNQNTIETDYQGTYEIQLWNENSGLVKTLNGEQSKLQISLRGLPKGMYYVHLIIEGKTIQKKILWLK